MDDKDEIIKSLPKKFYFIFIFIFIIIIIIKYLTSKEDIFIEIDKLKNKMKNFNIDKLSILTKINTKINRDYLDNSKYYNTKGFKEIYGQNYDEYVHSNLNNLNRNNAQRNINCQNYNSKNSLINKRYNEQKIINTKKNPKLYSKSNNKVNNSKNINNNQNINNIPNNNIINGYNDLNNKTTSTKTNSYNRSKKMRIVGLSPSIIPIHQKYYMIMEKKIKIYLLYDMVVHHNLEKQIKK